MTRIHQPAITGGALLAAILATGCSINVGHAQVVQADEKFFTVEGRPEVELKTFDGPIEVNAWTEPRVKVLIERRAGNEADAKALEVKAEQRGNRIVVEAIQPKGSDGIQVGFHTGRSVKLTVWLPEESAIQARTGDGAISATGLSGAIDLQTGDGSVKGSRLAGTVTISTGDGAVALEDVTGEVSVRTGDGSVRIAGRPTRLAAHTGDGAVVVTVGGTTAMSADWDITTGDGSVALSFPDGFGAEIDAGTGDGRIVADDFGLEAEGEQKDRLRGRIGDGGRTVRVRTGDGGIRITRS